MFIKYDEAKIRRKEVQMAEAGTCGSCVFTTDVGDEQADIQYCKIWDDPQVKESFRHPSAWSHAGICSKYQLNPAGLDKD